MRKRHSRTVLLSVMLAAASLVSAPRVVRADEINVPLGSKRQLVIGQLAGLQLSTNGTSFAGPLGFSTNNFSADNLAGLKVPTTISTTTFWFAPAADVFVVDRLSIGAHLQVSTQSSSVTLPLPSGAEYTEDHPSTTTVAVLPRVGYMVPVGARFGIWPRAGIGYRSEQYLVGDIRSRTTRGSFSGVYFGADVNGIWRATEQLYFVVAPEFLFSPGSHTGEIASGSRLSASASVFQFAIRTGFGVLFDL